MFKIAGRIGSTVGRLEQSITYSELIEWEAYFEHETDSYEKQDYYLAQIAQCCLLPYAGQHKPTIKDMLIKFKDAKAKKVSPKTLRNKLLSWFGISPPEEKEK